MSPVCPHCAAHVANGACESCGRSISSPSGFIISEVPGTRTQQFVDAGQEEMTGESLPTLPPSSWPSFDVPGVGAPVDSELGYTTLAPQGWDDRSLETEEACQGVDLVTDQGQRVSISGAGLLGRNPASKDPSITCVAINDPERSISKVHMEFGFDKEGFWVKDRGSTNGSAISRDGLQHLALTPDEVVRVRVGDSLMLGRRRISVEKVSQV
ncbi:MAG: FHA domain-containing protein [Propionibacteriaceae bacterium]|nr:FHA domain-containing protein [Propionibacteriaceae bacterium]